MDDNSRVAWDPMLKKAWLLQSAKGVEDSCEQLVVYLRRCGRGGGEGGRGAVSWQLRCVCAFVLQRTVRVLQNQGSTAAHFSPCALLLTYMTDRAGHTL